MWTWRWAWGGASAGLVVACTSHGAPAPAVVEEVAAPEPVPHAVAEPTPEPAVVAPPSLSDPPGGMTLRLPDLGTPRATIARDVPQCEPEDEHGTSCRFHGRIAPLPADCEGGCSWWTYGFRDDRLHRVELERSSVDVDEVWAEELLGDATRVADELEARIGRPPEVDEHPWAWAEVESRDDGAELVLARKVWDGPGQRVTWTVKGVQAHHPIFELRVVVDDELRIRWAPPTAEPGAPLLHLLGGPFAQPHSVPLLLELGSRPADECEIYNDAVVFELADGRVYLGQYNARCGGQACRVVDPATGEVSEAKACLFGDGMHHVVEPIGGGYYLLTSTSEGGGTMSFERYDPAVGTERVLELGLSAFAVIETQVDRGAVVLTTPCELPRGCEARDYGRRPWKRWRWTPQQGLHPDDGSSHAE